MNNIQNLFRKLLKISLIFLLVAPLTSKAEGAAFSIQPKYGNFSVGTTIEAKIWLNSKNNSVNAAEGVIKYSTDTLQALKITQGSLFNFWQNPPIIQTNRIIFAGGRNQNYTQSGNLFSVTFKTLKPGSARVWFDSGRILSADGEGTLNYGGAEPAQWSIGTSSKTQLAPPVITSSTHPNSNSWYKFTQSEFNIEQDPLATQNALILDQNPNTEPNIYTPKTAVYSAPVSSGIYYLHVTSKSQNNTSPTTHFKLQIDTTSPYISKISTSLMGKISISSQDDLSGIKTLQIIHNNQALETVSNPPKTLTNMVSAKIGQNLLSITLLDHAGNTSNLEISFYYFPIYLCFLILLLILFLCFLINKNRRKLKPRVKTGV